MKLTPVLCFLLVAAAQGHARALPPSESEPPRAARSKSSPLLERLARDPRERARELVLEAGALLAAAEQSLGDYAYLCKRTLEAPGGASALASLRGRGLALRKLARESFRRHAAVSAALARLERAIELAPSEPAILHARARALGSLEKPREPGSCEVIRSDHEAVAALEALEAAHTEYLPGQVAFDLGVMRTRAGALRAAQRAYEQSIALAENPADTAIARTNLAEVTMLLEDFESALEHYDRALSVATRPREHALAAYGRAVVLDRLGEHARAIEQLKRSFGATRAGLEALRAPGVFFEPPRELSYYDALGHEALATAATGTERLRLLRGALDGYRAFLAESPPRSLAAAAGAGVIRVERLLASQKQPARARGPAQAATTNAETLP